MSRKRLSEVSRRLRELESLERRDVPALIATQLTLNPPLLQQGEVETLLDRASKATSANDAIIAVVDRGGNILGVRVQGGVSPLITGDQEKLGFAVDGAVSLARTAAFFANDQAPLTSRTVQFISQSTVAQREVDSDPNIVDPSSTVRGPGFVAPVGIGGHFPPGIPQTPLVDLFGIENTNRDSYLNPGPDTIKGTPDDIALQGRFNINPAFVPPGQTLNAPLAYNETLLTPAQQRDPTINHFQSRGIGTLPGGIPLYKDGSLVGGIGVFFPGTTGYATEENSSLSTTYDPTKPDLSLEAEFMALAAAGGSSGAGFPVGALNGTPALSGFDIPFGRIDLAGITLDVIGPGGNQGPANLVSYAQAHFGVGTGTTVGGKDLPVDSGGDTLLAGQPVPQGYLVKPHAGGGLSAADVQRMIEQGIAEAQQTRAQIRLPIGTTTQMVFAVSDKAGDVLGLYRMPDATVFSIDVAVAKARNDAYYNDPNQLQPQDQVPGVPKGVAFTSRTYRYLASPFFPEGIDGAPPGYFSILNAPGINPANGLNTGAPLPASAYNGTVFGYDAFHPETNFHQPTDLANQNGVVFFPGSSGVYKGTLLVGGFGVSGDGVNEDDFITNGGISGYDAPIGIRADQFFVSNVRLPYLKYPRNPLVIN
jgi:uncharacterized protein GlcG (DUF336 family)